MQSIAIALVTAALGGLGVLAFKRPGIFIRLHGKLQVVSVVVYIAVSIYSLAFSFGANTALRFVDSSKLAAAEAALEGRSLSYWWAILVYAALTAFLHFLYWLATEVAKEDANKGSAASQD